MDLQIKHVRQFILTAHSHAARKDLTSAEETVVGRTW